MILENAILDIVWWLKHDRQESFLFNFDDFESKKLKTNMQYL